jgi:arylsulfatase A-like enzyme
MELEASSGGTTSANPYWPRLCLQARDDVMYHGKAAMCRTHEYKYVRRVYESDELYDLRRDPGETRNVVNEPAYAAVAAQLRDRLLTWYQETCDVVPFDGDRRW